MKKGRIMFKKMDLPLFLILFLSFSAFTQTLITDDNWVSMRGNNYEVFSLIVDHSDNLYAGGVFDTAGGIRANNIARWDGITWSALSSGMNGTVNAITIDHSGNLYAGGNFSSAGGINANHIARWDGSAWSALGSGVNGGIRTLVFDRLGNLYAAGNFDSAGGVHAKCVARWDGSAWSALGNSPLVNAIAADDSGNIYAFNDFFVLKWNSIKWETLGQVDMNSNIYTLALDKSNNLYIGAGGWGGTSSILWLGKGAGFACVAKYNGSMWSSVGTGSWVVPGSMISPYVTSLAFDSSGNLYAGGYFYKAGGVDANYIARYDGSSWCALGRGLAGNAGPIPPVTVNALVVDNSDNLYVGGMFNSAGGKQAAGFAKCVLNGVPVNSSLRNANKPHESPTIIDNKLFFSLAKPSIAQFKVFDCAGRVMLRFNQKIFSAGKHIMDIGTLSTGVYLLDFRAGDVSYREKFNVTR